jgi:hypothetical protein
VSLIRHSNVNMYENFDCPRGCPFDCWAVSRAPKFGPEATSCHRSCVISSADLSLSNSYSAASVCLSVKQARFVTMGAIGRMWTFFQLVPLWHLAEPSFGPIWWTAWPPGRKMRKSTKKYKRCSFSWTVDWIFLKWSGFLEIKLFFRMFFDFITRWHCRRNLMICRLKAFFEFSRASQLSEMADEKEQI